jgi:TPR repeat protein
MQLISEFVRIFEHKYKVSDEYKSGSSFYLGLGGEKNLNEAFNLFSKAADSGDGAAEYVLSRLFLSGEGTSVDKVEAVKWLKIAAEADICEAQYDLGICNFFGTNSLERLRTRLTDNWEAFPFIFVTLPPKNFTPPNFPSSIPPEVAAKFTRTMYQSHRMIPPNVPPGIIPYEPLTAPLRRIGSFRIPLFGDEHMAYLEGFDADNDRKNAIDCFRRAAQQGLSVAQAVLGNFLTIYGDNPQEGFDFLNQAAKQDDPEALVSLGNFYSQGLSIRQDLPKAIYCYRRAADKGDFEGILCQIFAELHTQQPIRKSVTLKKLRSLANLGFVSAKELLEKLEGTEQKIH